jgi:hypothetical protein
MESTETKLPIKDAKEAAVALAALSVFAYECLAKKEFNFLTAMSLVPKIQVAYEGYQNVLPQLQDLETSEGAEIVAAVAAQLSIVPEKAKKIVLASLHIVPGLLELKDAIEG